MESKVEIKVNGKTYGGWKEVSVKRSMKALSGSFELSVTDRWSGLREPWPLAKGDQATVLINSETVITGYIDTVKRSESPDSRSISVSGRCLTADLIDCSVDLNDTQFFSQRLDAIARKLATPFGIDVVVETSVGSAIETATLQVGESPFEFLDRLARKCGVLLTSDTLGRLVITRPGNERTKTQLVSGVNIQSCEFVDDMTDRFSLYKVKSQNNLGIRMQTQVDSDFVVMGSARDAGVKRHRPKVIQCETNASYAEARIRAEWEAKVRAARGEAVRCAVVGWTQSDGSLWRPNLTARIISPWLDLDEERLISEVSYELKSKGGTTCRLTLERKDAFIPEPVVAEEPSLASRLRADLGGQ